MIKNLTTYDAGLVKEYGKVMGYFDGPRPNLWIADDQLIKSIFVKDFDHFVDRRVIMLYNPKAIWLHNEYY